MNSTSGDVMANLDHFMDPGSLDDFLSHWLLILRLFFLDGDVSIEYLLGASDFRDIDWLRRLQVDPIRCDLRGLIKSCDVFRDWVHDEPDLLTISFSL